MPDEPENSLSFEFRELKTVMRGRWGITAGVVIVLAFLGFGAAGLLSWIF